MKTCRNCIYGLMEEGPVPFVDCLNEELLRVEVRDINFKGDCPGYAPKMAHWCVVCSKHIGKPLDQVRYWAPAHRGEPGPCCSLQCEDKYAIGVLGTVRIPERHVESGKTTQAG